MRLSKLSQCAHSLHPQLLYLLQIILRSKRSFVLLLQHLFDVYFGKEGMGKDFLVTLRSKPCILVLLQQPQDQVLSYRRDREAVPLGIGEVNRATGNTVEHDALVRIVEGRDADQHLVDQNAEAPPIDGVVVADASEHLRREVLRSPTE